MYTDLSNEKKIAPPKLLVMGIMAVCHAGSASNEEKPGCSGYIGIILPSYVEINITQYKDPY